MSNKLLDQLVARLETKILGENRERAVENLPPLPRLEMVLLGQFSLLIRDQIAERIPLLATADLDAWINPEWVTKRILSETLNELGLRYDELSKEIWMPKDAKREVLYESQLVKIEAFSVLDVLVSKAVKAAKKNRYLLQHALVLFGAELEQRLRQYNVNPEDFLDEQD